MHHICYDLYRNSSLSVAVLCTVSSFCALNSLLPLGRGPPIFAINMLNCSVIAAELYDSSATKTLSSLIPSYIMAFCVRTMMLFRCISISAGICCLANNTSTVLFLGAINPYYSHVVLLYLKVRFHGVYNICPSWAIENILHIKCGQ